MMDMKAWIAAAAFGTSVVSGGAGYAVHTSNRITTVEVRQEQILETVKDTKRDAAWIRRYLMTNKATGGS